MSQRLTVIGGGPGGYTAAFAAARAGLQVTLIEREALGGTCLNWGCIPTKTLKASADALELALRLSEFGVVGSGTPTIDAVAVRTRKDKVCDVLRGGLEKTCTKLGIRLLRGQATLVNTKNTQVNEEHIEHDVLIVATGSSVLSLPTLPFDHKHIISSDDALNLESIPASVVIVGGGVIGCEMAFIYHAFGAKVTLIEGQNDILPLPSVDADMRALLRKEMKKRRIVCETGRTLKDVVVENGVVRGVIGVSPFIEKPTAAQSKETPFEAEKVLVTVGRVPNTKDMGLNENGVVLDTRGWIVVNDTMQTAIENIYAIGDVLGPAKVMLAHVAAMEGLCAVKNICGTTTPMDYKAVPSGIFTSPEIGCVGLSEAQAVEAGYSVRIATMNVRELGKAQAMGELPGLFKIVAEAEKGTVLGVHIAGAHATDLVAEATLAIQLGATIDDLINTIHAHPTLAEGLFETALSMHE